MIDGVIGNFLTSGEGCAPRAQIPPLLVFSSCARKRLKNVGIFAGIFVFNTSLIV